VAKITEEQSSVPETLLIIHSKNMPVLFKVLLHPDIFQGDKNDELKYISVAKNTHSPKINSCLKKIFQLCAA